VRLARNNTHYLEINEARVVDQDKRERSRLTLFSEHLNNFQAALGRSIEAVRQPVTGEEQPDRTRPPDNPDRRPSV